jgi:8-oxo-dGTP diphosphatase
MPRSVAGIARDGEKFFIAKRLPGGTLGGKWEFPGGKVEEGESEHDALQREFIEEFETAIEVGPILARTSFEHAGARFDLTAYEIGFDPSRLALREHTEWRWAALDEIETIDFADSDRKLLEQLRNGGGAAAEDTAKR